jgi:GNAT superfamily N-acetyltransferase
VEVRVVEAGDSPSAFVVLEQVAAEREFPTLMPGDEALVLLTSPPPQYRFSCLSCVEGDEVIGAAWLTWSLAENQHMLVADIAVDAAHRRLGAGSALLDAVRAEGVRGGRSVLLGETFSPYGAEVGPGSAFAAARGFISQYAAMHQVLDYPVAGLSEKALEVAPHHRDYTFVTWDGECPAEYVEDFCGMLSLVDDEVPLDELEIEPKRWTPERLRSVEAHRRTQGRFASTTVAVAPGGSLAGYTELTGSPQRSGRLDQCDTLVRPEHRGHRLGLALKITNLQALQAQTQAPATIHTWNAEANSPMIAVNNHLGFRPVEHQHVWVNQLAV